MSSNSAQVNDSGLLDVGDGHQIFWQAVGNRNGIPVLFLHGGPGSGFKPYHPPLFDLDKVYLVLFDQRGCGRSQSIDPLFANTTSNLINDIEKLRKFLKIDKWWVCGHSWGSALCMLYAAQHTEKCNGLIPVSVFLAGLPDIEELCNEMASENPQKWVELNKVLNAGSYDEVANFMVSSLRASVEGSKIEALALYADLAGMAGNLDKARSKGLIYWHYIANNFFVGGNRNMVLEGASRLPAGLPVTIIHGEDDVVCPIYQAKELHKALPHSRLVSVAGVGHTLQSEVFFNAVRQVISETIV